MTSPTISIAFQTDKPLAAYGPLAHAAEAYGFDGVSVYNDLLYQPAWLPLLEMARHTRRVWLGPAAVNPFTCHPLTIAGNIASLTKPPRAGPILAWRVARGSTGSASSPPAPSGPWARRLPAFAICSRGRRRPTPATSSRWRAATHCAGPLGGRTFPFYLARGARTIRACAPYIAAVKVGARPIRRCCGT